MNARTCTLPLGLASLSALAFALVLPAPARAVPVVVDFQGILYQVVDPATGVAVNDPIRGRIRYETVADPEVVLPDQQVVYRNNLQELTLEILHAGSIVHSFSSSDGRTMVVKGPNYYSFYASGSGGLSGQTLLGRPIESLTLSLNSEFARPDATVDLPTELSVSMFSPTSSLMSVQVDDNDVLSAYVTSLQTVPEPSGLVLALLLLPVLARVAAARRRSSRPGASCPCR